MQERGQVRDGMRCEGCKMGAKDSMIMGLPPPTVKLLKARRANIPSPII